jgi:hypothetical protein
MMCSVRGTSPRALTAKHAVHRVQHLLHLFHASLHTDMSQSAKARDAIPTCCASTGNAMPLATSANCCTLALMLLRMGCKSTLCVTRLGI